MFNCTADGLGADAVTSADGAKRSTMGCVPAPALFVSGMLAAGRRIDAATGLQKRLRIATGERLDARYAYRQ